MKFVTGLCASMLKTGNKQGKKKKKKILKYSSEFQILSAANRRKSHVH